MKRALGGSTVFGLAAVLLGVISLMWHDGDTWQTLSEIRRLPFGSSIGGFLMAAQIAGGIAILYAGSARLGATILGAVYFLFSLACVPDVIAAPSVYAHYGSFFEQFSALCGAIALYAATERNEGRAAALGRAGRLGIGLCAVSFTLSQIFYFSATASLVPAWIPPGRMFWAAATTAAFGLAAIAVLSNRMAGLALRLTTLMLGLFGALVWIPRLAAHPEAHLNWSEFGLTLLIAGAVRVSA